MPAGPGEVRIHPGDAPTEGTGAPRRGDHPTPSHDPGHAHQHQHAHEVHDTQTVAVQRALLEKNDRLAERNRGFFLAKRLLVLNLISSPGSGKTTLIEATARRLAGRLQAGVIVGDLATENDAQRLREAGLPAVQITTGSVCHLEAEMVARAMNHLDLDALDLLIIENVGNLVCPAAYDLGENLRVVLMSVTEGEDKPLKYPTMFHSAHVVLLTKTDLAEAVGFDRDQAMANLHRVAHHAQILEVSARTDAGMEAWIDLLAAEHQKLFPAA